MKLYNVIVFVLMIGSSAAYAQPSTKTPNWKPFQFLIGDWIGEGSGQPGQGGGRSSFAYDLQKRVIIRKNFADYPATKDRPAFSHNDLMIVYYEQDTIPRAIYFDNEGHVIHYTVTMSDTSWIFDTNETAPAPNFRLTYRKLGDAILRISFEIAPSGKPFSPYIEATAHRK